METWRYPPDPSRWFPNPFAQPINDPRTISADHKTRHIAARTLMYVRANYRAIVDKFWPVSKRLSSISWTPRMPLPSAGCSPNIPWGSLETRAEGYVLLLVLRSAVRGLRSLSLNTPFSWCPRLDKVEELYNERAWLDKNRRRGRKVARELAAMPMPGSRIDQSANSKAFSKKSSCVSATASMYRNLMIEHIEPLNIDVWLVRVL